MVLIATLSGVLPLCAQQSLTIAQINISGNKKTKEIVILRELPFAVGDKWDSVNVQAQMEKAEKLVYRLGLFNKVTISYSMFNAKEIICNVQVQERWYHIPIPIFEIADRNFNVWWNEKNHDPGRLVYGLTYFMENMRGRDERLWIGGHLGFSQGLVAGYSFPAINKKNNLGLQLFAKYQRNKQINIRDVNNKQEFLSSDKFIRRQYSGGATLIYRLNSYDRFYGGLYYFNTKVADTVIIENRNYFYQKHLTQQSIDFAWRFESDHRDVHDYPLKGYTWSIEAIKKGIYFFKDIDQFDFYANAAYYQPLSHHLYLSGMLKTKLSYPDNQSYFNQNGLGYDQDFVRSYEYYVVHANHYVLGRFNLKKTLYNRGVNLSKIIKDGRFNKLPLHILLKTYFDFAYTGKTWYQKTNPLDNEFLYGGGIGIDIATWYDYVIRVEYSLSKASENSGKKIQNGVFLHISLDIDDKMRYLKDSRSYKIK